MTSFSPQACWILQNFDEIRFKSEQNIVAAMNCIQNALLNDHDLPVKVEAAMALSAFLASQNKAEKIVEPNVSLSASILFFPSRYIVHWSVYSDNFGYRYSLFLMNSKVSLSQGDAVFLKIFIVLHLFPRPDPTHCTGITQGHKGDRKR